MQKHAVIPIILISMLFLMFSCGRKSEDAIVKPDGTSAFTVIRSDDASVCPPEFAVSLKNAIIGITGVDIGIKTDFVSDRIPDSAEGEYEIIVGKTSREITAELAPLAPRLNDWLIARRGGKIVIYGQDKLGDATAYFLEHYASDGNIYVPDGETYIHKDDGYIADSITIDGADLKDFVIRADKEKEPAALALSDRIAEIYGYSLKVTTRPGNTQEGRQIIFTSGETPDQTISRIYADDGNLYLEPGALTGDNVIAELLIKYITGNMNDKKLEITDTLDLKEDTMDKRYVIADADYLASLDEKAEKMKQSVLGTASDYTVGDGGKVYYFAANGDDSNDGLTEKNPFKTLSKLSELPLNSGDVVLFRRGDTFRGSITAAKGVTYSAWGKGDKPTISASKMNYALPELWQETSYENVWVCTKTLVNVGIVTLDHSGEYGKYDELVGTRMIAGKDGFDGAGDMKNDLEVWSDLEANRLYFYSDKGNPGERFKSIEIGERGNAISVNAPGVTVDNLHITLTGSHGVGAGTTKNLTVRNCVFDWLGGSILTGFDGANVTGYGNAVEVYGGVEGYHVYNNWIYQIYDTGITHQFSYDESIERNIMADIEYNDNLIEYCFWSIEYYNSTGGAGTYRETRDVYVHDNFCRFGGEGWGCKGRESGAPMYCIASKPDKTENYVTEKNIFDRCLGYLVSTYGENMAGIYVFRSNTYVQPNGAKFARVTDADWMFDGAAADRMEKYFGEESPVLAVIVE